MNLPLINWPTRWRETCSSNQLVRFLLAVQKLKHQRQTLRLSTLSQRLRSVLLTLIPIHLTITCWLVVWLLSMYLVSVLSTRKVSWPLETINKFWPIKLSLTGSMVVHAPLLVVADSIQSLLIGLLVRWLLLDFHIWVPCPTPLLQLVLTVWRWLLLKRVFLLGTTIIVKMDFSLVLEGTLVRISIPWLNSPILVPY